MKMILMRKGITDNGLNITEEMILNSLDTFINKPIVLNYKQKLKNYTENETVSEFNKTNAVGYIISANYNKENGLVEGEVSFKHNKCIRDKFDNWQIELSKDKKSFVYCSCEIFE
jgi:hypothetical protein